MSVRRVRREELADCRKIQATAFSYCFDEEAFARRLEKGEESEEGMYGFYDDAGCVAACAYIGRYTVRFEGARVGMGGVGGVASLPECRGNGAVREIIRQTLRDMRDEDMPLSVLYPFSHPFYRRFGYELCRFDTEYTVRMRALEKYKHTGWARAVAMPDDIAALNGVYDRFAARYNLSAVRGEAEWKRVVRGTPHGNGTYAYLLGEGAEPFASVTFHIDRAQEIHCAHIDDYAFASPEAMRALMGFMHRFEAQCGTIRLKLPDDVKVGALFDETYDVEPRRASQPMARVTDPARILSLLGGEYVIRIEDTFLPENTGTYRVSGDAVTRTNDAPDLETDIQTFAPLALGYLSLDDARFCDGVRVCGNEAALRAVYRRRDVYLADYF